MNSMRPSVVLLVSILVILYAGSGRAQAQTDSTDPKTAEASRDAATTGCGQPSNQGKLTVSDIKEMLAPKGPSGQTVAAVSDKVILSAVQGQVGSLGLSPHDIAELKGAGASDELLTTLASGSDVYIGWSVLPSKVVRDNYGRYVMDKYFGVDVVIANRNDGSNNKNVPQSLIVTALEFCLDQSREVSIDPALVRGSLQKGELTGRRSIIAHTIEGVGDVAVPSSAFFKNQIHKGTFTAGTALFSPLRTGFDLVWPDTILTYLANWDKDEVFKKGFIVAAGGSTRGRIFIPIELVYPRSNQKWKPATKGKYDPEEIKKTIGTLVVLGQQITLGEQRRYVKSGRD